ncbi:heme biosynthesis protein HemY [Tianweitania sp. BSSL-BM11]|uniref:Heme biosynthesis protein HemY n=1 Tax=Tianweitania aestuarii TaxID=2814886 RepID=A0ABS5RZE4_9HYPH|nr:heme biosynthesis protein HemY [Tianweitania aestuarii]MBS9721589.1 heme biosynthesis protein HemY [Tianweitania aestuarii]
MIRLLVFLLAVFAFGLGFTWLADRPGEMMMTFGGYQYRVSLMVAIVTVVAIVAGVMLLWWVLKGLWRSPYTVTRYFRTRRRDRGYQALSTGLIAAGAGDAAKAKSMRKQAAKLINADREPLVHLLDAQTAMLEGDHDGARKKFEAMLDDPETRLLGLRGLYLEAERHGDHAAARHYAGRASAVAPQLAWASDATLEDKVAQGDWDSALRIVDAQKSTKQIDRDVLNRRKAVMLTGKAMTLFESQFDQAKAAAIEANRLQPEFVPAAVIAARAYFRGDELRRGSKILEHVWKRKPHPEVAQAYVFARPGNSTQDRLPRAQKLQSLRNNNVESALVVARAALDAREFHLAREQAEAALRLEPRESVYLLLADIEEADVRNQGKIREYLSKAVRAQRDPAWTADGMIFDTWAPVSPISGRFDVFEWKTPVERAAPVIEDHRDEPAQEPEPEQAETHPTIVSLPVAVGAPPPTVLEVVQPEPEAEVEPAVVEDTAPVQTAAKTDADQDDTSAEEAFAASEADRSVDEAQPVDDEKKKPLELTRLPDDPGVSDDEKKEPARFRLF